VRRDCRYVYKVSCRSGLTFLQEMYRIIKSQKMKIRVKYPAPQKQNWTNSGPEESGLQRSTESPWHLGEILAKIFA